MKRDPSAILLEQCLKGSLGPFYIIRPPIINSNDPQANPNTWIHSFFHQFLSQQKNVSLEKASELEKLGVSDLYHIRKNKDHKEYKVDEEGVKEFVKAHSYPALELPYKFVAVHESEKLSDRMANKWLKTLEEPLESVVTLFLTDSNQALLQTIESRAITLRLSPTSKQNADQAMPGEDLPAFLERLLKEDSKLAHAISDTQKKHLHKFIKNPLKTHHLLDSLKGSRDYQDELFSAFQNYAMVHNPTSHFGDQWLKESQWYEESRAYNNSVGERFLGLLQLIQAGQS